MSNHFSMGAINKTNDKYEYPKIANKINKYKCPFCEKDVIFRNGKIKQPHFAHYKSNNPCSYYDKPNETQIHKDAKLLMKTLLDNKYPINIYKNCFYCKHSENFLNIRVEEYKVNINAVIEYRFNYNNSKRSADVALLENKEIKYIFEICYTNPTEEVNRPEPWFEFKAETLINETNSGKNINKEGEIKIECIRYYKCICCKEKEEYEKKRQIDFLEKLKIKGEEQKTEKNELLNMSKEDERTIKIEKTLELKKEEERKKIIGQRIAKEREIERQRIAKEREVKKEKEKELEKIRQKEKLDQHMKNLIDINRRCNICNVNYCKCSNPQFLKNEYDKTMCNFCKKSKCMCVRITDFFKK
jgi:hypothetical protein